ncbi:NACHT domain-containing protein [Pseudanabaena sp. ABRG5-3]|uniref:NACHT domain-containing protein n=1 Tax=Pseudanabaena sp. ABRG5-3 TaxID=685565 RepID=UPI000DC739C1|nr:NACHT domain-containing NTPase [Pseudanabaena sp. ABRG5-3]BBC23461.1 signal transduction protein with Nacht domain [Pseudanabaena sp. ABRG5-3]
MAKPTYTASTVGKEKANAAFKRSGKTQEFIAGNSGTTRQLVSNFLKGLSVEQPKFIAICEALELRWQEIAELDEVEVTNNSSLKELEILVQEVKQKIAADVTDRCGTMRVLDMTQPVDLDRIYTDVNIIKEVTGRRRIGYDEVMEVCTREHFDRFLVGTIKERVKGSEAVEEFQKLVVLGKPGAGKTTFMKYLAMACLGGRFHGELVPIFVTLKAYAEERGQPSLENYILMEFAKRKVSQDVAKQLLDNGKALILLDGLDEVKKEDDRRVKRDIDKFSRDWLKNRFAITCRIAAREYQFEKFTEVEVADFDDGQIKTFVNNWFWERDEAKAARLLEKLEDNEPVKELATNPLLLTLLCLVFGERNDFPPKRSELYKEGLEVLMKKWDAKRNIEREIIYKHLSPQNKEDMLGQIAFNTFLNGEYFFRQEDLQRQIKDYICNLPEASADPDALRLDSEVVLKAIEHHHGLLVERARNIYSFSHLTFQEYFAAREIERERHFEKLIENISNPRWKEIFYLTAEMLRRSDVFCRLMKKRIDGILTNDENLQAFLEWANQKTNSMQFGYKTVVAARAFYAYVEAYTLDLNRSIISDLTNDLALARTSTSDLDSDIARDLNIARIRHLNIDLALAIARSSAIDRDLNIDIALDIALALDLDLALVRDIAHAIVRDIDIVSDSSLVNDVARDNALVRDINSDSDIARLRDMARLLDITRGSARVRDITLALARDLGDDVLQQKLQALNSKLPANREEVDRWWENHGEEWTNELRQVCIDHRNIGHDWQFTKEQAELLNQYYSANLLLVECMNRSYVSKEVREEIEATMLLPSKK